jgi:DNA replication and repair protein RecF
MVISKGSINDNAKRKKLFINQLPTNPKKFKSNIETLLYSPHNADIVSSAPVVRREQFDRIIGQFSREYTDLLLEYKFIVRSRNKLLARIREHKASVDELDFWDDRLIKAGEKIIEIRVLFLNDLKIYLADYANKVFSSKPSDVEILYLSKVFAENEISLREKIEENREKEIMAGMSLYGPHRDRFVFELNGQPLRDFGSRAQQRLAGLSLILSLYEYFRQKLGRYPILLLDDIMSELDEAHRKRIEKILMHEIKSQVIITSSEKKYFHQNFLQKVNLL